MAKKLLAYYLGANDVSRCRGNGRGGITARSRRARRRENISLLGDREAVKGDPLIDLKENENNGSPPRRASVRRLIYSIYHNQFRTIVSQQPPFPPPSPCPKKNTHTHPPLSNSSASLSNSSAPGVGVCVVSWPIWFLCFACVCVCVCLFVCSIDREAYVSLRKTKKRKNGNGF